jgi:hypothetical protein
MASKTIRTCDLCLGEVEASDVGALTVPNWPETVPASPESPQQTFESELYKTIFGRQAPGRTGNARTFDVCGGCARSLVTVAAAHRYAMEELK